MQCTEKKSGVVIITFALATRNVPETPLYSPALCEQGDCVWRELSYMAL